MSQKGVVLRLLEETGVSGVSAHTLTYRYGITRAAAYVFDLRQEGYDIETVDEGEGMQARYILKGVPAGVSVRVAGRPIPPPDHHLMPLPDPVDLPLPCGCVRAADGRSWVSRCETHQP